LLRFLQFHETLRSQKERKKLVRETERERGREKTRCQAENELLMEKKADGRMQHKQKIQRNDFV